MCKQVNTIISYATGKKLEMVANAVERGYCLGSNRAIKYGIVNIIISASDDLIYLKIY